MNFLTHPLFSNLGIEHGFGTKLTVPPSNIFLPRQVHSSFVASWGREDSPPKDGTVADGVTTTDPKRAIGIVSADCVPILLASEDGSAVGVIHAGWRGFSSGIVDETFKSMRLIASTKAVYSLIGPHVGPCCYEIDQPVIDALLPRFGNGLNEALEPSRKGHFHLDLGSLATLSLARGLISPARQSRLRDSCTKCQEDRFHSFRRDGEKAGRMTHWVKAKCVAA
ncbi:polyphenol oxidase family protein [Myxococcota bacterium]|nr:polyphenol oxidase family protein [Myxococcota bacterium]